MRSTRAAAKPCCENSSIAAARIAARVRDDLSYSRRRGLPFARLRLRPLNTLSPHCGVDHAFDETACPQRARVDVEVLQCLPAMRVDRLLLRLEHRPVFLEDARI